MNLRTWKIPLVVAIIFASLTILLTFMPLTREQQNLIGKNDKILHAIVFAILTFCVAWSASKFISNPILLIVGTAITIGLFSLGDEAIQAFVPSRTSSAADLLANGLGICTGLILFSILHWQLRRRQANRILPADTID